MAKKSRLKKTNCNTLANFAREEQKTAVDYALRGFRRQSKQELEHAGFFRKQFMKCKKKRKRR